MNDFLIQCRKRKKRKLSSDCSKLTFIMNHHFRTPEAPLANSDAPSASVPKLKNETSNILDVALVGLKGERGNKKHAAPRKQRMEWTSEEDDILLDMIPKKIYPHERIWKGLASKFNEQSKHTVRTAKDCRERWQNVLDPKLTKSSWDPKELEIIEKIYNSCGPKWAAMAKILKGRSERDIKNIWNSKQRKSKSTKSGLRTSFVNSLGQMDDGSALLGPSGSSPPIFPPDFSFDPIEPPNALQIPLNLRTAEVEVAETLYRSLLNGVVHQESHTSPSLLTPPWTTTDMLPENLARFGTDEFKALDPFCEEWS